MSRTLLLTVDSLRYDHLRHMPSTRSYLDREHDRAFSTFPETFGSFPSIVGGQYATERGLPRGNAVASKMAGKRVGITTNHLLSPGYNYDEGFDQFSAPTAGGEGIAAVVSDRVELGSTLYTVLSTVYNQIERARARVSRPGKSFRRADDVIGEFLDAVEGHDEWFGWLHFMEPHHPYDPHSAPVSRDYANRISRKAVSDRVHGEEAELVRELYRRECEELDVELRRLYESVPEDTRVVFCADHGELLGEGGTWGHPGLLHPLLHHVPFGTKNVDRELGEVVSLVDVPSVLADEEHGLGRFDRDVAFGLYGERRAATDGERFTDFDPDRSRGEQYRTRTLTGDGAADAGHLREAIEEFSIDGGVTRYDADEETLAHLGYLE